MKNKRIGLKSKELKKTGFPNSNTKRESCRPTMWTSERVYQLIYKLTLN